MNIKKLALLLLAAAMLSFVLPSCSKNPEKNTDKNSAENGIVWRGERTYIDGINVDGAKENADNFLYHDGKVYFKTTEYTDGLEDPGGSKIVITIYFVNIDGSGLTSIPIIDSENEYFSNFAISSRGDIVFLDTVMDIGSGTAEYFLKTFSPEGSEISSVNITSAVDSLEDEYFYVRSIAVHESGNIYICSYSYTAAFSPDGKLIFGKKTDDYYGINRLVLSASGDIYGCVYMDGYALKKIDPLTGELGEEIKLTNTQYSYSAVPYGGAGETEIYVDDGTALTALDP